MNIGLLNQLIDIEEKIDTITRVGQKKASWQTKYSQIWANVETLGGNETVTAGQGVSSADIKVLIRYRDDVTAKMRILHDDKYYEIVSVIPKKSKKNEMELMCKEVK